MAKPRPPANGSAPAPAPAQDVAPSNSARARKPRALAEPKESAPPLPGEMQERGKGGKRKAPAPGATRRSAPAKGKPARPTIYTEELATIILDKLASGQFLNAICEPENMPSQRMVNYWVLQDDAFASRFARARELQAVAFIQQAAEIADQARMTEETLIRETTTAKGVKITTREVRKHDGVERDRLRVHVRLKWAQQVLMTMAQRRSSDEEAGRPQGEGEEGAGQLKVTIVGGLPRERGRGEPGQLEEMNAQLERSSKRLEEDGDGGKGEDPS